MLLRRITKHIKDQNWFAVFVDFLIVVVGVFIGIQVANWNEERLNEKSQKLVHERLVNDFKMLEEFSIQALNRHKEIIINLETLVKAFERGSALPEEDDAIKFALRWGGSYRKTMLRSPTYIELLSSGQLNLITNNNIRSALAVFDQAALSTEYNYRSIHNAMLAAYGYLPKYAVLEDVNHANPLVRTVKSYNFSDMMADTKYHEQQKVALDLQSWFYSNIENHNRALKEVLEILQENK